MNKTITINIAGLSFHIDEEAYDQLDAYIHAVRNSIHQEENREEIIDDIESRIAELFAERVDPQSGVISKSHVDEIINIMGKPEDYIIEEDGSSSTHTYTSKQTKKLYRDGDKRVLGGICAGIGHYLNVDPVWIRVIFILLFFMYGVSILVYFIMWIIIPKASTVAEKLEMKGEPVNISNIEKQFRAGISNSYQAIKNNGKTAGDVLRKIFGVILIGLGAIGIFCSFFVPIIFSSKQFHLFGMDVNHIIISDTLSIPFWVLSLCLFLIVFLPFVLCTLLGIKVMGSKIKHIGLISLILGILFLIALFVFSYGMIKSNKISPFSYTPYNTKVVSKENFDTQFTKKDLMVGANDTLQLLFERDARILTINDTITTGIKFGENDNVEVKIYASNIGKAYMEIEEKKHVHAKESYTKDFGNATANVTIESMGSSQTLDYYFEIKQDTLILANNILATKNKFTKENEVGVKIFIAPEQIIKINGRHKNFIDDVELLPGVNYYQFQNGELRPVVGK